MLNSSQRDETASIHALQRLIREKEEHISQLLEERDIERSDLARVTLDRESVDAEAAQQRTQIERLNAQLQNMEVAYRVMQEEHEQLQGRLHEERKALEDLQFRMEEEHIDRSVIDTRPDDDDEPRIFELEEALMSARETNERLEAEVARMREELSAIRNNQPPAQTEQIEQSSAVHTESQPLESDPSLDSSNQSTHAVQSDDSLKNELDRLRKELADRELLTESSLKRQADALQVVSSDYEKQLAELNASLTVASKEVIRSNEEASAAKLREKATTDALQNEIANLKAKLLEHETKSRDLLTCSENQLKDLTAALEAEKNKTSATVLEQSVALRKLEEKLQLAERKMMNYQSAILSSAELCAEVETEQMTKLDTSQSDESAAVLAQLQAKQANWKAQREELARALEERDRVLTSQHASESKIEQLETQLQSLRTELVESSQIQEELTESLKKACQVRDQFVSEVTELLEKLPGSSMCSSPAADDLARTLRLRMEELSERAMEAETSRSNFESRLATLEAEHAELERELILAKAAAPTPQDEANDAALIQQLESIRNRMSGMELGTANTLKELESKSVELQALQQRLDRTLAERTQLEQSHNEAMTVLESEKQQLLNRISIAEAGSKESSKAEISANHHPQLDKLIEEKSSADCQITFLNSIIVDLHQKNAELEERVRSMLTGLDGSSATRISKPRLPPRLWCDNCLVFDSHETENCPTGQPVVGTTAAVRVPKKRISQKNYDSQNRVYCSNCGVFDSHSTDRCTDAQTF